MSFIVYSYRLRKKEVESTDIVDITAQKEARFI